MLSLMNPHGSYTVYLRFPERNDKIMRKKAENPALFTAYFNIRTKIRKFLTLLTVLILCASAGSGIAETSVPDDGLSSGDPAFSGESPGFTMLTEDSFASDDLPDDCLTESDHPGRVEKLRYTTSDENREVKSVMVYLPEGYDDSEESYNVLYILHAASGTPKNYLNPEKATDFQCLLDHMIADGVLKPLIVVAAS